MKPAFVLAVSMVMLCLFLVDKFLAGVERKELVSEAASLHRQGAELLAEGQAQAAIGPLQRAATLVRSNRSYRVALANALLAVGRLTETETILRDLLESDSNDGAANLSMARLQARLDQRGEAEAYYHRAIYGTWPAGHHATEVRMELAEFLAKHGEQEQLLSELLLLQDEAKGKPAAQRRVADLFLIAGSPARARETYRSLLKHDPNDAYAYLGMAETELVVGDFGAAQTSLRRALRHSPGDPKIEQRLHLSSVLSMLDPTPRRLTSKEKYQRSVSLLGLANASLTTCLHESGDVEKIQPLLDKAEQQHPARRSVTNEMAESLLDLAAELWKARVEVCGTPDSANGDPLPILMHKIGE
jgi:tetratricopeptide (TPR) repeat protein